MFCPDCLEKDCTCPTHKDIGKARKPVCGECAKLKKERDRYFDLFSKVLRWALEAGIVSLSVDKDARLKKESE